MGIDLMALQPHKVSRDLSGYITYVYGAEKSGKTTFASHMPSPLILAFERGYNALPGVIAQDITTWGEMKQTLRELKKPEVKEVKKDMDCGLTLENCQDYKERDIIEVYDMVEVKR